MRYLNSPFLAFVVVLGFVWLAHASRHEEASYTHSVFSVMEVPTSAKQRQASVLKELWDISDDEVDKPIAIFGN